MSPAGRPGARTTLRPSGRRVTVAPVAPAEQSVEPDDLEDRRSFWTDYQPGFRFTSEEIGTPEFFAAVEANRYSLEPHIPEVACFEATRGLDVLEGGCGIATDGLQFARAGARYTGADFSATALSLAQHRFELEGAEGRFVRASLTELPFDDDSFDIVYSNGVVHHLPETAQVIREFHRVLRPGGRAAVMVYHRDSFNYRFTIMTLRRALVSTLLLPGASRVVGAITGESPQLLDEHARLLRTHGLGYLRDRQLFLNHNTDGPGNPLAKVYSRGDALALFSGFAHVETEVRYLNLRLFPGGERLAATALARRLERRWGWHLWVRATKAGG